MEEARTAPLRNRVQPDGVIVANRSRGTFTGNRGILVDRSGAMMRRQWAGKAWITCLLSFKGRERDLAQPGQWTELFFLDEAVAFSAGHRPCARCRRADYDAFKAGFPDAPLATEMDKTLHAERLSGRVKRLHEVAFDALPNGSFALQSDQPHLVWDDAIYPYTPEGYLAPLPRPSGVSACLTPPSILAVLRSGYAPSLHPTAAEQGALTKP